MDEERWVRWEPVGDLDQSAGSMDFEYSSYGVLNVRLSFQKSDLLLKFSGAIAVSWESECFGLTFEKAVLPTCHSQERGPTFPLLKIERSTWLAKHVARHPVESERRVHFAFVTGDDLLHVLALPEVDAQWTEQRSDLP